MSNLANNRPDKSQLQIGAQKQLFESDNTFFPKPHANETLYSWCVRFHRLSSNRKSYITSKQLFRNASAGFRHDFPSHLANFSEITQDLFGDIDKLIYEHTIFPIFAPFLSRVAVNDAIQNMTNGVRTRVTYRLGQRGSPDFTIAPLKACPYCIHEDVDILGYPIWHVDHQIPTVLTCPKHNNLLSMTSQSFHAGGLKDWHFPNGIPNSEWEFIMTTPYSIRPRLSKLSKWSIGFLQYAERTFDPDLLRAALYLRARKRGFVTDDGALKLKLLTKEFCSAYKNIDQVPGFSFIKGAHLEHGGFIGSIMLNIGYNKHPLRNLLLMEFLFDTPEMFISECEHAHDQEMLSNDKTDSD